jgi:hypothetical protein
MIRAAPRRFLVSALGSRVVAFGGLAVAVLWVSTAGDLFLQLAVCEVLVGLWFAVRIRSSVDIVDVPPGIPSPRTALASRGPRAGQRID